MSRSLYEKLRAVEKGEWLAIAAIAALVAVCFFFRLGGVALLGKDEPRYAEVAREMVATGDWITPRLAGVAWFEKPALPYWLMAAGYRLFGVGELAARLGSAGLATLAVAAVYAVARRAGGPRRAAIAAASLATSALWLAFARGASFDMPLAATMTLALAAFYAFETSESARTRTGWAAAAGAMLGASMLAKGLVGPLLLGGIVAVYLTASGAWRRLRARDALAAFAAAALVAALWYLPVWLRNGWPFVEEFFVNHHFKRYTTDKYHHPQPFYFYLLIALGGFLPWSFLLLGAMRRFWRTAAAAIAGRATSGDERLLLLAASWVAVPLLFFSFSSSKLPGYILPIFPALALLVAWAIATRPQSSRAVSFWLTGAAAAAIGVGLAIYAARTLGAPVWEIAVIAIPLVAGGALVPLARRWWGALAGVWAAAAWSALAAVAIALFLFGELGARESLRDLSIAARDALGPGERVALLGVHEYGPAFYAEGRMVVGDDDQILVADTIDEVAALALRAPGSSVLCVTDAARAASLGDDDRFRIKSLGAERDRVLVRVTRPAP